MLNYDYFYLNGWKVFERILKVLPWRSHGDETSVVMLTIDRDEINNNNNNIDDTLISKTERVIDGNKRNK